MDNEIDGEPHFYNVPVGWLPHLGRLTVLSSRMEEAVTVMLEALGRERHSSGRTLSFTSETKLLRRFLKSPPGSLEQRLPGWAERASSWAEGARDEMNSARHRYVHGHYFHLYVGDGRWEPVRHEPRESHQSECVTEEVLIAAIERLRRYELEGTQLSSDIRIEWCRGEF
ncbi:hypothetical protein [Ruania albidiflava]|uniref:hypothetical protein n=1 Tax=Ruania albidiflava TaxID=366586 RepID=UPI0004036913|nr:hypothetical protein [Ruania albidiflava]